MKDFCKKKHEYFFHFLPFLFFFLTLLMFFLRISNYCSDNCSEINSVNHCDRCIKNRAPRVSRVLESVQYLLWSNKSLVRFGDGEITLIMGHGEFFQKPNQKLSLKLKEVFVDNLTDIAVGIPDAFNEKMPLNKENYNFWKDNEVILQWIISHTDKNRQYLAAHMTSTYMTTRGTNCELLDKIYDTYREIWKDKDIIFVRANHSQKYIFDIFDNTKSMKIIYVPPRQTWNYYEEIKKEVFKEDRNKLYILSIGPTSNVLVYDLVKDGRKALNLGHLPKDYDHYKRKFFDPKYWID